MKIIKGLKNFNSKKNRENLKNGKKGKRVFFRQRSRQKSQKEELSLAKITQEEGCGAVSRIGERQNNFCSDNVWQPLPRGTKI